jgi:hypothetical protein
MVLEAMKQTLQSSIPASLKNVEGSSNDFVEMKVFTARDLQKLYPVQCVKDPIQDLPLFGDTAIKAFEEL